jgi:hypothetical protein
LQKTSGLTIFDPKIIPFYLSTSHGIASGAQLIYLLSMKETTGSPCFKHWYVSPFQLFINSDDNLFNVWQKNHA